MLAASALRAIVVQTIPAISPAAKIINCHGPPVSHNTMKADASFLRTTYSAHVSTLGAVLGGGQSTRMGSDKALVEVDGVSMLERVTTALASVAHRVVILGTDYEGFESWPDQDQGAGPLFGIATALARAEAGRVLVVAVDHAFVRSETLARLVGMKTELSVVPVDKDGVRQVTCAVYPVSIADLAAEEAGAGGSIQSLLDRVSFQPVTPETWTAWGEDGRSWFSADTPEAIEEGVSRFSG